MSTAQERVMNYVAMETSRAEAYRRGDPDAYGQQPRVMISDGGGYPCRHCLDDIEAGRPVLLLAYRPFSSSHPYAETGPVFLCGEACDRYEGSGLPPVIARRPAALVRAYDDKEQIVANTGGTLATVDIPGRLEELLGREGVASVHLRSAMNGCFTCRVIKSEG